MADWIERESLARLGMYCKRIQGLYWHFKYSIFRNIMKDRAAARRQLKKYNSNVTILQAYARRMVYVKRAQLVAQGFLIKYVTFRDVI
tara:strand:+ start:414 stop:677 length:264 start_codon:yes stop_codon:yes gene_type:complete